MKRIKIQKSDQVAIVDDEDFFIVSLFTWWRASHGYPMTFFFYKGKRYTLFMHNLLLFPIQGKMADHINGDPLDNRKINLRRCTVQQNGMNKRKPSGIYTSQFKGVCYEKKRNRWKADIGVNNKIINLGRYKSEKEAAIAYNVAAKLYFGQYANLNIIE